MYGDVVVGLLVVVHVGWPLRLIRQWLGHLPLVGAYEYAVFLVASGENLADKKVIEGRQLIGKSSGVGITTRLMKCGDRQS